MKQRIAIVGIGGIFPGAGDLKQFWENIVAAKDSAREPPPGRWPLSLADVYQAEGPVADKVYSRRACFVDEFTLDMSGLKLEQDLLESLDPMFHLLLHAGRRAWSDAVTEQLDTQRSGIVMGNIALPTDASSRIADEVFLPKYEQQIFGHTHTQATTHWQNAYVAGLPAAILAQALGLTGGSYTLDAACASSLYAVKYAVDELQAGRADAMLCGGLSRPDPLYTQMGFSALHAISASGRCSPFDHKADGLVVGEGCGMLVLKRLRDAVEQGDHIYATIAGLGLSNDIGGNLMSPDAEGQRRAMHAAYKQANWRPADVDLIECHGTGTPVGDAVEFASLASLRAAEPNDAECVIGSVKSNIGHLLTAAGAAGLIKVLLAMQHTKLPPTANFESAAKTIDLQDTPFSVLSECKDWGRRDDATPRRAAVSAFGFGGINAHVLLEEWDSELQQDRPKLAAAMVNVAAVADVAAMADDIAIVGMETWHGDCDSLQAFSRRLFAADKVAQQRCTIEQIDIPVGRFRIPPHELKAMLPQQLLMLQVAANALADAGIAQDAATLHTQAGVYIGIALDLNTTNFHVRWGLLDKAREWAQKAGLNLSASELAAWVEELKEAMSPALTADRTMGALGGIVASRVARAFNIGGPSFTVSNEQVSGLRALQMGVRALQRFDINMAIVGAVDFASDERMQTVYAAQTAQAANATQGDGAVALVLKRYQDAQQAGDRIYAVVKGMGNTLHKDATVAIEQAVAEAQLTTRQVQRLDTALVDDMADDMAGDMADDMAAYMPYSEYGVAASLITVVRDSLALSHSLLPHTVSARAQFWLRDRADGARHSLVVGDSIDGNYMSVVLQQPEQAVSLTTALPLTLFSITANDNEGLASQLEDLRIKAVQGTDTITGLAHAQLQENRQAHALAVSLLVSDKPELQKHLQLAMTAVQTNVAIADGQVFFTPQPLAAQGELAFVFPGSGNHYHDMGREAARCWPEIMQRLDAENAYLASQFAKRCFWLAEPKSPLSHAEMIFGQVCLSTMISDVIASHAITPAAVIGYSLGETAGLFALRAWKDRDVMLQRMQASPLFTRDLAGPCEAARQVWGITNNDLEIDWQLGLVNISATEVNAQLAGKQRVYLLIVNTPNECIIGGDRHELQQVVKALACQFHPIEGVATVHCEVVMPVANEYRDLHLFETTPPAGVRFYSGVWGKQYAVNTDTAADSIVGQALQSFDYTTVINQAYADGVRLFVEMGPGNSCSRMIGQILGERPHVTAAACVKGQNEAETILTTLAQLNSQRVPMDLHALYTKSNETQTELRQPDAVLSIPVKRQTIKISLPQKNAKPSIPQTVVASAAVASQQPHVLQHPASQMLEQMQRVEAARAAAQEAFLKVANGLDATMSQAVAMQMRLLESLPEEARHIPVATPRAIPQAIPQAIPMTTPRAISQTISMARADTPEHTPEHTSEHTPEHTPGSASVEQTAAVAFDRDMCMEFAIGSIAKMLGPQFAEVDQYPTRVRLPAAPLMLVDRILTVTGEAGSMTQGRVVTEHDVQAEAWYLDAGRIPTCIAVEAGQADLFLSAYLGIDQQTKGQAVYRLLDAEVTFHGPLPHAGQVIRYDIHIEHFFRQGDTWLFRFHFDGTVDGKLLITMRQGCAGFFSDAELAAGKGIVLTRLEKQPQQGRYTGGWQELVAMQSEAYSDAQLSALRRGDIGGCFGGAFAQLPFQQAAGLPDGRMNLVHRILELDPQGGRFGMGSIIAEADIHADDWFISCHFVDDHVMPGTLMYECCLHTLRVYLLRMGWVGEADKMVYEPVPGVAGKLKCRGQVLATTSQVQYAITLKEVGYNEAGIPYVIADALMSADGHAIVQMTDMSLQLSGLRQQQLVELWQGQAAVQQAAMDAHTVLFDYDSINAFAVGKPSVAFGEPYRIFDEGRVIARLPGPPFQFLDRIIAIENCQQWEMAAGGVISGQYDVPPDAWYFQENRQVDMPFSVLLEIALQPCGWLAGYLGSALSSESDLSFRNLGGKATQFIPVTAATGTLTITVKITNVAQSGGMIIQNFDFAVSGDKGLVYAGETNFGFFSKAALANQLGLRDVELYQPCAAELAETPSHAYPEHRPFPAQMMRMLDRIDCYSRDGGTHGLGFIRGQADVDPQAWFFQAHFYQDPVWPGSLGLESFIQLLKYVAYDRWSDGINPEQIKFETLGLNDLHKWVYRGQIIPKDSRVSIQAVMTARHDAEKCLQADGFLTVDGRIIYQMNDFTLRMSFL